MTARLAFIPAPSLGWNTRDPIAQMKPGYAPIMDNMIVEDGSPLVRMGFEEWATGLPGRVDGLLPWNGAGASQKLFAASGTGIYDVTAGGAVGAAAVGGLTSARWSSVNVAATGGNYIFCFNGVDTARTYDGSAWASWTGTGVTGGVSWANVMNGRLFVGNTSRLSFYYGGAGAIGGAFTEFPLQGVAQRGGGVCAMATISIDGGAGPQTLSCFLTTEGEAIVYAGTDPSSISTWGLVGRWRIPPLIGAPHRCVAQYGGDALALTTTGVLPLARLSSGEDVTQVMERHGLTRAIAPTWRTLTAERGTSSGWGITPLTSQDLIVFNVPWSSTTAQQIVVSSDEAVSRWGGIPAAVWTQGLGGRAFFGDSTTGGKVYVYGEDTSDNGSGIRAECMTAFTTLGSAGLVKSVPMIQPVLRNAGGSTIGLNLRSDMRVPVAQMDALGPAATAPALPADPAEGYLVWNVGNWAEALWAGVSGSVEVSWKGTTALAYAIAPRALIVGGNTGRLAWLGTNVRYSIGGGMR